MRLNPLPCAALALVFLPLQAGANDTSAALGAGGLTFERNEDVAIVSEDLFVSMDQIRVRYVFRNRSAKPVTTIVAFPLPALKADMQESPLNIPNAGDPNFVAFETKVGGQRVPLKLDRRATFKSRDVTGMLVVNGAPLNPLAPGFSDKIAALAPKDRDQLIKAGLIGKDEIDQGKGPEPYYRPAWDLATSYYRQQTFPPKQDVLVEHTYRPVVGGTVQPLLSSPEVWKTEQRRYKKAYCVDDAFEKAGAKLDPASTQERWISYILKTGANWAGPIGQFTLTVDKGASQNLVSFCGDDIKKISPTQFQMRAKNYKPRKNKNLNVLILTPASPAR
ncbi:MAG TPA: DUF4424 domain-containing protein [Caulobacterales bacterium]|nr:DUF4424 domain-containing protein [Caulobacterales bacterium]